MIRKISIFFAATFVVLSCSNKGGEENPGNGGTYTPSLAASLTSTTLDNPAALKAFNTPSSCQVTVGSTTTSGNCITPINVKAKGTRLSTYSSIGSVPARLIDFSASAPGSGIEGPYGILGVAEVDLSNPLPITNPYSDDNLQDVTTNPIFNRLAVWISALEIQFEVPSANTNVINRFWTIRYPFIPQDLSTITGFNDCSAVDSHTAEVATSAEGKIYSAPTGFLAGDLLICQKPAATDVCTDTDFSYINTADGSVTTTRPSAPVKLSGTYLLDHPSSCSVTEGRPSMSIGYMSLSASLSAGFRLTKTINSGKSSYTLTENCNTSTCSGTAQTGSALVITADYDMASGVFIPSTLNITSDSEATLRANLDKILLKALFIANNRIVEGSGDDPGIAASISFELSDALPEDTVTEKE